MAAPRLSPGTIVALVGYFLLMTGLVIGLSKLRGQVIADLSTPAARADWEAWRQREAPQEKGVIHRRVPKSEEPPHLVLLRDYFWGVLFSLGLVVSFMYAALVLLIRGMIQSPAAPQLPPSDPIP